MYVIVIPKDKKQYRVEEIRKIQHTSTGMPILVQRISTNKLFETAIIIDNKLFGSTNPRIHVGIPKDKNFELQFVKKH